MRPIYHPQAAVAIRAETVSPSNNLAPKHAGEFATAHDKTVTGTAARAAEIADATVIASIDVTDQSMGRGQAFRDHEYSRRSWVRFAPERLNTRVIDALRQLNFGGEVVAAGSPSSGSN